ncbi:MAG: L-arabinose isomerase family protein, partial [Solirubrobacteraceae bacterium]
MSGKPFQDAELWFVAGSQHLYGDDVLARVAEQSGEIAAALSESLPVVLVPKPVVTGPDAIRRLCLDANASDACVGIVAWMHTFSPAKMWIAGLRALDKPLLHLHTQFNAALPWSEIDMDFMNLNQSAHGDREFAHLATRMRLRRKTVVGHWRDAQTLERIATWSRAACGWREAQRLNVARFGDNMRQVAVTEGDKVEAQVRFGVAVNGYGAGDLADAVGEVGSDAIDQLLAAYEDAYDLVPELRATGARRDALVEAARIEAGLRSFLEEGGFGAFTDTFEDLHGLAQLPGIAAQRLMADGSGFGAEGDLKTAALLRIFKV